MLRKTNMSWITGTSPNGNLTTCGLLIWSLSAEQRLHSATQRWKSGNSGFNLNIASNTRQGWKVTKSQFGCILYYESQCQFPYPVSHSIYPLGRSWVGRLGPIVSFLFWMWFPLQLRIKLSPSSVRPEAWVPPQMRDLHWCTPFQPLSPGTTPSHFISLLNALQWPGITSGTEESQSLQGSLTSSPMVHWTGQGQLEWSARKFYQRASPPSPLGWLGLNQQQWMVLKAKWPTGAVRNGNTHLIPCHTFYYETNKVFKNS